MGVRVMRRRQNARQRQIRARKGRRGKAHRRRVVGAVDGHRVTSVQGGAEDVGHLVGEHVQQCLARSQALHRAQIVVQRIGVGAVGVQGESAVEAVQGGGAVRQPVEQAAQDAERVGRDGQRARGGEPDVFRANDVDDHAGDDHMLVNGQIVGQHAPNPAFFMEKMFAFSPAFEFRGGAGEKHMPGEVGLELIQRNGAGVFPVFRKDDFGFVFSQFRQHAGAVVLEQGDAGQCQRGNEADVVYRNDAAFQPGPLRSAEAGGGRCCQIRSARRRSGETPCPCRRDSVVREWIR